jgi:uncharacterized membrane protein (DUF4010 family)
MKLVTDECSMNKLLVAILGISLILASAAIFAYDSFETSPPYLSSANGQSTNVDYVAFFCFGLGGAGFLILLFALLQLFGKLGPERGGMVKRDTRH